MPQIILPGVRHVERFVTYHGVDGELAVLLLKVVRRLVVVAHFRVVVQEIGATLRYPVKHLQTARGKQSRQLLFYMYCTMTKACFTIISTEDTERKK